MRMIIRHLCRWVLLLVPVAVPAVVPPTTGSEPAIIDVAEKLKLISVGDFYRIGNKTLVCVEDSTHTKFLWDPADQNGSPPPSGGCRPPEGVGFANALVELPPVEGYIPVPHITGVSGGASIVRNSPGFTHCDPNLMDYFTVSWPNGSSYSFYVIVRVKKPLKVTLDASCESAGGKERVSYQNFDQIATLSSIDVGNGTTLLSGYNGEASEPVLLQVRAFPQSMWSSNHNVFIVPRAMLEPMLKEAGNEAAKRYEALRRAIGDSR